MKVTLKTRKMMKVIVLVWSTYWLPTTSEVAIRMNKQALVCIVYLPNLVKSGNSSIRPRLNDMTC